MGRIAGVVVGVLLLAATVAIAAAAPARAEAGPYPVWWSPKLELESLDKIDERLARPIWPDGSGIRVYKGEQSEVETPELVRTCQEVLAAFRAGMSGWTGNEHALLWYHYSWCRAIEVLKDMMPAAESYVRDFKLDARTISFLPALTLGLVSCEMLCRGVLMNRRGESLHALEPEARVENVADHEAKLVTPGWAARLRIVALGDADGDGVEDMIVISSYNATEGTLTGTDVFVLTRHGDDEILRILDDASYVETPCGRHYCDLR